ncbi:GGDEF domain-containing protein [Acinetobacter shaoyimingii]|uniref:diguanylate cyclase n=1 Tax=Acinetobacter shaoyimingii TaxID=2715164 RepID=A0A6G8RX24_9GAMM|nr:GGDEF domain-containing protein [Acinetobacter shaoyimingii]NHB57881.1 diguanylate cyclase [Acinetobacter shaoyimingii]QIO06479.1 diguanylate cyclase [Acinetobacter shaoyimingii]
MHSEQNIDDLQAKKTHYEHLLERQNRKLSSKFDHELEQHFWRDRKERLIKMLHRAKSSIVVVFLIFQFLSIFINYLSADAEFLVHDISRNLISFAVAWLLLATIFTITHRPEWHQYYAKVLSVALCITLAIAQSILLSMQTMSLIWRGTIIISLALIFVYLTLGLRPRRAFLTCMLAAALSFLYLKITRSDLPNWVMANSLILPNLVGLALALLSISTERIRFLQSIVIDLDKQIYSLLNQHFIHLSHQDTLTLLGNRRGFEQNLENAIVHAQQTQEAFAILFIDVDYFKLYNDCYGHECGDQALIKVAKTLLAHIREGDIAIRFGGEEFVLLIKNTSWQESEHIAQAIIHDIQQQKIEHAKSQISSYLTVSIGLSLYDGEDEISYPDILKAADQALYVAKDQGRNGYHTASVRSQDSLLL